VRTRRALRRLLPGDSVSLLVVLGLAVFVVTVYLIVVLGGGAILGRTASPSVLLSVLATTVVALLFAPVQALLEKQALRLGRGAATPYDVLSRFSETMTGDAGEPLPARMAMVLAKGTGADWAQVWLTVAGRLALAATWPAEADVPGGPPAPGADARDGTVEGRRALVVRHSGQELGVLRLQERPGQPLTTVEERLFTGLAAQAGLVLSLVRLRAELESQHAELVHRADELRASRQRLIATHDSERRRLERDMHDGAQQHLVALAVNLRLVETVAAHSPGRAVRLLAEQADAARVAIETLSSLSRGIYPRLLSDEGLVPALRSAMEASAIPVDVDADSCDRPVASVEAALYFCCLEAVQNAAKHSGAEHVSVHLTVLRTVWQLTVSDDGGGFDEVRPREGGGVGMANMRDRVDSVGGTLAVRSRPGGGTIVTATVSSPDLLEPALS
jgi:signal transduction histidine kinase